MIRNRHNLLSLFIASILTISLLSIDALKLAHHFHHHIAKVCTQNDSVHFHEKPLDCKFCGIHFSPAVDFESNSFESFGTIFNAEIPSFYQSFKRFNLARSYSLRGPPAIA